MKPYILIVEDNPIESLRLSKVIEIVGYIPILTKDGFAALEACEKYNIDAALVDIQMPHMDGFSFLGRIGRSSEKKKFPIIMMTANRADQKSIKEAISLGASDFIVKPIDIQILSSKLDGLLKNRIQWNEWTIVNSGLPPVAMVALPIEVQTISEMGLRFFSDRPVEVGGMIDFNWPVLKDVGIESLSLKVGECEKKGNGYSIYLMFLGVPEHQLQKIRQLCLKLSTHQFREAKNIQ